MLKLLWELRRYRPLIAAILAVLRDNTDLLDEKVARPDTNPAEDARDFLRQADDEQFWDEFADYG